MSSNGPFYLGLLILTLFLLYTTAPESMEVAGSTITQRNLYITLFVIGVPLLWLSSPISTFFWIVGASGILIFGHASLMEPGIESEYAAVQDAV